MNTNNLKPIMQITQKFIDFFSGNCFWHIENDQQRYFLALKNKDFDFEKYQNPNNDPNDILFDILSYFTLETENNFKNDFHNPITKQMKINAFTSKQVQFYCHISGKETVLTFDSDLIVYENTCDLTRKKGYKRFSYFVNELRSESITSYLSDCYLVYIIYYILFSHKAFPKELKSQICKLTQFNPK
jgi:hypothetical protein